MQELRKERLIILLIIMAQIGFIMETIIQQWEPWAVPIMSAGIIGMLYVHFSQKIKASSRVIVYFILAALSIFYMGIHENGLINPAILIVLLMTSFSLFNKPRYLNIAFAEYILIIIYRLIVFGIEDGKIGGYSIYSIVAYMIILSTIFALCHISVSDRRMTLEEMEQLNKNANKNQDDVDDFLSNISHELRTPINVIGGMTAIISKDIDTKEYQSLREANIRLTHQIDDIQDYTEVRRNELILMENDYMCDSLIRDVVTYYQSVRKNKNLELIVDLAPDTPSVLRGDIEKLHKIFRHLIDNAIKFTKKGGIYLKIYTKPQEYGVNLVIEVIDSGIGMSRSQIAQISSGLYQANKKRNRSTGGIGLGFTIIYGFVRKMSGFVKVDSTKGKGTKVHVAIPQKVVDKTPCMSVTSDKAGDVLYYVKSDRIQVPILREFNRSMATNLATGIGLRLFATGEMKEFERLLGELNVTHMVTTKTEYDDNKEYFDKLSQDGYVVIVSTDEDYSVTSDKGVLFIPKPIYGADIVRIINEEYTLDNNTNGISQSFVGIKALVVDDEPMNLVVASGLFKDYGLVVDTAESGKEAISKFEDGEYDVIFMDHMMPEMDGVEAMKCIREISTKTNKKVVILALTANVLSGAREMFIKEGFDGFLSKPINLSEFVRVMNSTLPEEMISREGGSDV